LLFARPSQLPILRALQDSQEGMSGRAIAREAGINHQACAQALRHLESLGLVRRLGTGRTQLMRLNFSHHLVKELILPLLQKEREISCRTSGVKSPNSSRTRLWRSLSLEASHEARTFPVATWIS
jgi:hypothetical protein